jgi:imidazolonepropionase-like amidohydrolase
LAVSADIREFPLTTPSDPARALALASILLALTAASAKAEPSSPSVVIYRGAAVIDVQTGLARPGLSILTKGERIERIAPSAEMATPVGAKVVDVAGLYVSPGLINTHEHLATPPNRPYAEAMMKKDLYGGVTAVRDMATLATTIGAVAGQVPWMQAITPKTDMEIAVAEARGTGATAIKIYADLPGDLVYAITKEAHRQGILVWTHAAVFPASPAEVIGAGVDTVSHVCMLAYQASDVMPRAYHNRAPVDAARFAHGDNPVVEGLFRDMKRRGTILDATLRVYVELGEQHAAHPKSPPPYCSADLAERLANEAYRDGVAISAGTDGFSGAADPWPSLQDELELLQDKAGMKPADVVRAATLVGAKAAGQAKDMGTLEPGKLANMVFTAQNPLSDVRAYRTVVLTVKRGADFWRKDYTPPAKPVGGEDE